ncbi:hypothetical protein [Shewanella avicenniae]|uniref:hypothetical protein n=1 Tax=Shewanella avicenniae TaxID=2814294 RepID=UPI001E474311|nr:hypothetical protein [Shewanella avicenniae]
MPNEEVWHSLNAEQKMALYRLQGYGYRLLFVRQLFAGPLAIIAQFDQLATISSDGAVDLSPSITLRA